MLENHASFCSTAVNIPHNPCSKALCQMINYICFSSLLELGELSMNHFVNLSAYVGRAPRQVNFQRGEIAMDCAAPFDVPNLGQFQ